jgi:hypothetical protein
MFLERVVGVNEGTSASEFLTGRVSRDDPSIMIALILAAPSPFRPPPLPFCITFLCCSGWVHECALFRCLLRGGSSSSDEHSRLRL